MAPFITKSSQQAPYIQGQAVVPIHRDSVVNIELTQATSRRTSLSMAQQGHVVSAYNATLPPSAHQQSDGGNEGLPYNDWMSQFCVEPKNDTSTCCLGFWVPCALYGKTHWRLDQINRGNDASNSKWQSKNGCNSACWAWCGLASCLSMPVSGIITGIQRAQIRGTYGIKGNCASDIALGMLCPSCTQMQNDREIRAREGDVQMRYNAKYLKTGQGHQLVSTQPLPTQPMSYNYADLVSAQPTGEKKQSNRSEQPSKLQKKNNPIPVHSKSERRKCSVEEKKRPTAHELESQRCAKKNALVQNAPKILVTQYQDQPLGTEKSGTKASKLAGKKAGIFGKFSSTKQDCIPEEPTRESMEPLSEQHTLVECDVVEIEDPANKHQVQVMHTLVECTIVENSSPEKSNSAGPREHMIMECTTVEDEISVERGSSGPSQHMIADCETVVEESFPSGETEEHHLKGCNTMPVSEDETPAQELSYVHDFTDCPVDKAILDYYEKEEKKAKQHELTDRIRTSLPTELLQVNQPISQHTLAECSEDETTPPSSPSNHRSTSYNLDRNNKNQGRSRQHRLTVKQHRGQFTMTSCLRRK
ncbi:PLAC8 family-domain-containing protein [Rhexocercosporidium sp. MPI-PUGE-AT-0058]|nr:PLAC8 family-domain-containing protein [Rhexocercosporidium sp. MPI-PUGE-AT-0058]